MDNSVQISEEEKNKIYNELTDLLLRALEGNTMDTGEAQSASTYILSRLDELRDRIMIEAFLEELVQRWHCFQPILLAQEVKDEETQQKESIQNIQNEIQQINQ